jgi:MATE family multidrug resistance protein
MALMALVMLVAPRILVGPFLDHSKPGSAEVAALAASFLLYAAIFQLADGAQVVGSSILRGLGDTRVPMIFAGVGYWLIGLPLSAALGLWTSLAGTGIWIGLVIGLTIVAALMLGRWRARERLGLVAA